MNSIVRRVPGHDRTLLPPILAGNSTPAIRKRVEQFYFSVASIFESWVQRRQSPHTQRAYREDILAFVRFLGIAWPAQATALLSASIKDVQAFRDELLARDAAPKTLNRRISSVSSFINTWERPRLSCGCPSPCRTRRTRSSSAGSPQTRARRRRRSQPRVPGSSWVCLLVTASLTFAIGRF